MSMNSLPTILNRSSHVISRKDIDPDALKVLYRLSRNGFKAYLVGGAVRDLLLGKRPKDFDVATDARPGQIKKLFSNCFLIGRRFRLAHIRFRGSKVIEVATFRKEPDILEEGQTDLHNTFGTPLEDAFRRDITINAMFYDIETFSVIDYVGGLKDMNERLICIIGDPEERYREDPVRMWRVLRHSARQGFSIETKTSRAIECNRDLLASCAGSRLYEELNKDMVSGYSSPIVANLMRYELLAVILGQVGKFYEQYLDARHNLGILLGSLDAAIRSGNIPPQVICYGALLWPWAQQVLRDSRQLQTDRTRLLADALAASGMPVIIPKSLKSNVIHCLEILECLMDAMDTGRMRWSLMKRASYKDAVTLFALASSGVIRHEEDAFLCAFRERYPGQRGTRRSRRRRRRPRSSGSFAGNTGERRV